MLLWCLNFDEAAGLFLQVTMASLMLSGRRLQQKIAFGAQPQQHCHSHLNTALFEALIVSHYELHKAGCNCKFESPRMPWGFLFYVDSNSKEKLMRDRLEPGSHCIL